MMMMSALKLVLIFGAALGLYHFINNAQNTNHLASVVPEYNYHTNYTDQLTTISALQLNPGFDYFLFVLQWPAAFCNLQRSRQYKCNPDPVLAKHQNKFTVHGLWPQLNSANSPLSCTPSQSMQDSYLIAVQNDLLEYWPSLFSAQNFQTSKGFWRHEWSKHGTRSSNKFTPQQYLKITLDLAKKYAKPIFDELQKQGIKPDGTKAHRLEDLRRIVMNITGRNPILNIVVNNSGDHLLLEIKLCVQNNGVTLMDCDEVLKFATP